MSKAEKLAKLFKAKKQRRKRTMMKLYGGDWPPGDPQPDPFPPGDPPPGPDPIPLPPL